MSIHLRAVIPPAPWTRALEDGTVSIPDVSWQWLADIPHAPERFIATQEADVGENGVRRLVIQRLGRSPAAALPVFFGREHMQRNLLVRADAALTGPNDLAGKRVGSHLSISSGTGAGVLLMLEQAYGVDLREIEWRMGDPASLPENRLGLRLGPGPQTDEEALDSLERGELDAVIVTRGPRYWSLFGGEEEDKAIEGRPIRPLVGDPRAIAETYRRSRLYPITDLVVMRPALADQQPDLPGALVDAFSRANALASRYRSPEEEALARREIDLLGEDPHLYGRNEHTLHNLRALIDFLYRLGAVERPIDPDDLFVTGS